MTVGAFETPRPHGGPKVMTVARIVTLGGRIPLTVRTFETRRKHEDPKVTTVARMTVLRRQKRRQLRGSRFGGGPIPVTVGTFERFGLGRGGDHTMGGWEGGVGSLGPGTYMPNA